MREGSNPPLLLLRERKLTLNQRPPEKRGRRQTLNQRPSEEKRKGLMPIDRGV